MITPRFAKWLVAPLLAGLAGGTFLPQDTGAGESSPTDEFDRAALEAAFAEKMTGATLLGHFTVDDQPGGLPQAEAYRLGEVSKVEDGDDEWRFESEIEYGDKKFTLPIVVQVKWAGDTPVITLTDMPVPMMGTFTARVVVYGDRYAGIWDGGDHGGQMFGRVVVDGEEETEEDD